MCRRPREGQLHPSVVISSTHSPIACSGSPAFAGTEFHTRYHMRAIMSITISMIAIMIPHHPSPGRRRRMRAATPCSLPPATICLSPTLTEETFVRPSPAALMRHFASHIGENCRSGILQGRLARRLLNTASYSKGGLQSAGSYLPSSALCGRCDTNLGFAEFRSSDRSKAANQGP